MLYSIPDTEDDETCLPLVANRRYYKYITNRNACRNHDYYIRHKEKVKDQINVAQAAQPSL